MNSENRRIAVVTCMDARLDAAGFLDGWPVPVHIVRNAGGRATPDVLRSLAVSCTMQIDRVLVIHHSQCAMAALTDDDIRQILPADPGVEMDFLTIADPVEALRQDVLTIRSSPLLPPSIEVSGFIYDLDSRAAREVEVDRDAGL
jgi:carbonic anhydrase